MWRLQNRWFGFQFACVLVIMFKPLCNRSPHLWTGRVVALAWTGWGLWGSGRWGMVEVQDRRLLGWRGGREAGRRWVTQSASTGTDGAEPELRQADMMWAILKGARAKYEADVTVSSKAEDEILHCWDGQIMDLRCADQSRSGVQTREGHTHTERKKEKRQHMEVESDHARSCIFNVNITKSAHI